MTTRTLLQRPTRSAPIRSRGGGLRARDRPAPRFTWAYAIASCLLLGWPGRAEAQVEPLIAARGQIVARFSGVVHQTTALRDPETGDRVPLGGHFFQSSLGTGQVPELSGIEEALQSLGGASPPPLVLGRTVGRITLGDDVVPLGLSYGITDRITAGVTVTRVRRRISSVLRYTPSGANVGVSPAVSDAATVAAFLAAAASSVSQTGTSVDAYCLGAGEVDPQCMTGRGLVQSAADFLSVLDQSFTDSDPFPLSGSDLGDAVDSRWAAIATGFTDWGAPDPGAVPLATAAFDDDGFRQLVVTPAWPGFGLPVASPEALWDSGDVELQGALRLIDELDASAGVRLRTDVGVTVRIPTGQPDSLRALAPTGSGSGVSGVEVDVASSLGIGSDFSVAFGGQAGWHGDRDVVLVSPDPDRPFSSGQTRARVRWSPAAHFRATLAPRIHLGPALSLATRWSLFHQGADHLTALDDPSPALRPTRSRTEQILGIELRYDALRPPVSNDLGLPFGAFLRVSGSFWGSAGTSVTRTVEGGVTVLLRR